MTEFYPPMSERSDDDLIRISNSSVEFWQQEAINQAKVELGNRGITIENEKEIYYSWLEESKQYDIEWQKQLIKNEFISYKFYQILISNAARDKFQSLSAI